MTGAPEAVPGHIVECDSCHAIAIVADGSDVHAALRCGCCPEDHNHGEAARATGTPCRPVHVHAGAVTAQLGFLGGQ